jgi:hypothetical protein
LSKFLCCDAPGKCFDGEFDSHQVLLIKFGDFIPRALVVEVRAKRVEAWIPQIYLSLPCATDLKEFNIQYMKPNKDDNFRAMRNA